MLKILLTSELLGMEGIISNNSAGKIPEISTCDDASDNMDIISNMPEAILHYIFSFLQTSDVVNTSILSRRWRYLWTSMPYLDFDLMQFSESLKSEPLHMAQTFEDFVNWVLLFQNGSTSLVRFRLLHGQSHKGYTVLRWVHAVARRTVQEIDLSYLPVEAFKLPHCLVTCESLVVLKLNLYQQVLELPSSRGFSRLKSLELECVELKDGELAKSFFSSCPLLERLSLINFVTAIKVLDISATNLKNLIIDAYDLCAEGDSHALCNTELKISCPKLVSYKYICNVARDYSLQNLSSLENVFIHLFDESWDASSKKLGYLISKFLVGICNAKVLHLSTVFLEVSR